MKLTPFAKIFISLIILSVVGYVLFTKRDNLQQWANNSQGAGGKSDGKDPKPPESVTPAGIGKDDFSGLAAAREAGKNGVTGIAKTNVGAGKLGRKLVVGINTWAGHAPGIIANGGLAGGDVNSIYLKKYGLDVEFKLLEDPQAKLAAFIKGDIDIMWDTVDSWSREASALAEQGKGGKAILQQDWSRGGDGIVSLQTIKSVEDLGSTAGSSRGAPPSGTPAETSSATSSRPVPVPSSTARRSPPSSAAASSTPPGATTLRSRSRSPCSRASLGPTCGPSPGRRSTSRPA